MRLNIPYQELQLIPYEGAGNRTPLLNIGVIKGISNRNPTDVKKILENDINFRNYIVEKGTTLEADSIMIFYKVRGEEFDFVTFIGEPNAPVTSKFSTMCGNGIRALALHIVLTENNFFIREKFLRDGIRIWAGGVKTIRVESFDATLNEGTISVEMGPFMCSKNALVSYVNSQFIRTETLKSLSITDLPNPILTEGFQLGIGFNGEEDGEPHLVMLSPWENYCTLLTRIGIKSKPSSRKEILDSLRRVVCFIGLHITFDQEIFPQGINVNLALTLNDGIYMSTHERNLSSGKDECFDLFQKNEYCRCNTMACGTGGAAVVNIAHLQRQTGEDIFTTYHPGGKIDYFLSTGQTIMIGPAKRVLSDLNLKEGGILNDTR